MSKEVNELLLLKEKEWKKLRRFFSLFASSLSFLSSFLFHSEWANFLTPIRGKNLTHYLINVMSTTNFHFLSVRGFELIFVEKCNRIKRIDRVDLFAIKCHKCSSKQATTILFYLFLYFSTARFRGFPSAFYFPRFVYLRPSKKPFSQTIKNAFFVFFSSSKKGT